MCARTAVHNSGYPSCCWWWRWPCLVCIMWTDYRLTLQRHCRHQSSQHLHSVGSAGLDRTFKWLGLDVVFSVWMLGISGWWAGVRGWGLAAGPLYSPSPAPHSINNFEHVKWASHQPPATSQASTSQAQHGAAVPGYSRAAHRPLRATGDTGTGRGTTGGLYVEATTR